MQTDILELLWLRQPARIRDRESSWMASNATHHDVNLPDRRGYVFLAIDKPSAFHSLVTLFGVSGEEQPENLTRYQPALPLRAAFTSWVNARANPPEWKRPVASRNIIALTLGL